ncbi:MAG TPA: hypothetical protein VJS65_12155 [Verrucomicrobiae bacterium]|nr:hypothetical protein [Verrucomicrobiae bacterium]
MNVFPVIERELRAEARNAITYGARPLGAAALLFASITFLSNPGSTLSGRELFSELHQFLLGTVWLCIPLISADCISREKREQTLGLLFLTPLKARDIMLAKTLTQGLRAATIGIAVVPVLALPLLMGGLSWPVVLSSLLTSASAFCWALAAGLLASVLSRSIMGGLLWAFLWAAVFLVVLSMLNGVVVLELIHSVSGRPRYFPSLEGLAGSGLLAMWHGEPVFYKSLAGLTAAGVQFWLIGSAGVLLCSLAGLAVVWQIGAWHLQKAWQELPPSPAVARMEKQFCQPRFATGLFRSLMKRQLNRNPVGWLERRSWTSRVAAWGWLGVFALGYTAFYLNFSDRHQVNELNSLMSNALMVAMALVSSASFRRERETGVMELLLTTSLTPEQIVRGRLFGLWVQFLPSVVTLVFMAGFSGLILNWTSPFSSLVQQAWYGGVFYVCVPVCGLWLSLALRHYILSVLLTVGLSLVLPYALTKGAMALFWVSARAGGQSLHPSMEPLLIVLISLSLIVGIWGASQLHQTVGWVGLCVIAAAMFGGLAIILTPPQYWRFSGRGFTRLSWLAPSLSLLAPFYVLAAAGFAHRKLLRMLRQRTFGFKV